VGRWTFSPSSGCAPPGTKPSDDHWDDVTSVIELDRSRFSSAALTGVIEFSHVEVVYLFDRVDPAKVERGIRHPRGNPQWPAVGIFAHRAKDRPNRLGLCTCEVTAVEGLTMGVRGLDAIDGTPVLDIKPYMVEFGPRTAVHQPAWSHELMEEYWSRL
jgi:tRNA-Thr(GGU) m(6)t(6)A37 methyltransferase TsaA